MKAIIFIFLCLSCSKEPDRPFNMPDMPQIPSDAFVQRTSDDEGRKTFMGHKSTSGELYLMAKWHADLTIKESNEVIIITIKK